MAQCKKCKEDMPLLSKICPVCGHVKEEGVEGVSVDQFVGKLDKCLHEIKSIPKPSFGKSMEQLTFIMFPILAIYMLILAFISEAGLFWILFGLFAVLSTMAIVRKSKRNLGNDPFNRRFAELKNDYEYNERIGKRSFGKSREVSQLLDDISGEIKIIEKNRKLSSSKNMILWVVIMVLIFIAAGCGVFAVDKALSDPAKMSTSEQLDAHNKAGDWEKVVEAYDKLDADARIPERENVLRTILTNGSAEAAENFFITNCMGEMQDYDYAVIILNHYKAKSDKTSAQNFVKKCAAMRYKSDIKKMNTLVESI